MSVYTSGIAQQYIDPFYISNERVEFRLDEDRVYLSGMRINNLTATTASGDGAKEVNNLAGFAGMIEHIYLYDNATVIDAMRHYPRYIAHKNLLVENDVCLSNLDSLKGTKLGMMNGSDATATGLDVFMANKSNVVSNYQESLATADKYWLDLKSVFPYLRNVNTVNTKMFKNLRIVIEFNTKQSDIHNGTSTTLNFKDTQPVLVVDELIGGNVGKMLNQNKKVEFVAIEHDQHILQGID